MSERAPELNIHPIVPFAASIIAEQSPSPPHTLDDAGADAIAEELSKLFGADELRRAVADLLRLACHLDLEAGSPDASRRLVRLLEEHAVEPLRALDAASGEAATLEVQEAKREFDRFRGDSTHPRAPRLGESAPRGSVKLGSLDYPKRG